MSPRAAWRLESLGFVEVYDYTAGKSDWFAAGLPREGSEAGVTRVGDLAERDVPRCGVHETVGEVRARLGPDGICVVVHGEDTVLGLVRREDLDTDDDGMVEEVMVEGPATLRPGVASAELAERFHGGSARSFLVTTPEGRLIGLLRASDLERWHETRGEGQEP